MSKINERKDCAGFWFVFKARQKTSPPWRIDLFISEVLRAYKFSLPVFQRATAQ
jgi:hypothetical protein